MNRHLLLLTLVQGLFLINNVTFIAINGLVGLQLAPHAWMATTASPGPGSGTWMSSRVTGSPFARATMPLTTCMASP